jgi:hypothetical protein
VSRRTSYTLQSENIFRWHIKIIFHTASHNFFLSNKHAPDSHKQTHTYQPHDTPPLQPTKRLQEFPFSNQGQKRERMFLAPAENHSRISSLKPSSKVEMHGRAPSKTHLFLCFQWLQATRMITLLKPFLLLLGILAEAFLHHSAKPDSLLLGATKERPIGVNILCQNYLVKTQLDRICCTVSSSWSHRTQFSG